MSVSHSSHHSTLAFPTIMAKHEALSAHPLYQNVKSLEDLKVFMESHVFAVWDFMSLLKRLQKEITCVEVPWKPSPFPKAMVRLINEIVLGEESDLDREGKACDHFTLYLDSMKEVKANPERLFAFFEKYDYSHCTEAEKNFVSFNLHLAQSGKIHEVAAAFFFGREKLIPDMFTSILKDFSQNFKGSHQELFPNLCYYLERHIEVDGGEHSHLAKDCLVALCGTDEVKWKEAEASGVRSLELRHQMWDEVLEKLKQ